jgi:hypothetical protein
LELTRRHVPARTLRRGRLAFGPRDETQIANERRHLVVDADFRSAAGGKARFDEEITRAR